MTAWQVIIAGLILAWGVWFFLSMSMAYYFCCLCRELREAQKDIFDETLEEIAMLPERESDG